MKLYELSIADISALMATLSRSMSKLPDSSNAVQTREWEDLAFKKSCLATEMKNRVDSIEFPIPKTKNT